MTMYGMEVSPASILKGDVIASRHKTVKNKDTGEPQIIITDTRKVKNVGFCDSGNGFIHIDGVCYDSRFTTVVRPI